MLRKIAQGLALVGVVVGVGALGAGCLDRPVTAAAPTIKTNFTSAVNQSGIDKIDILFDIDNSASMGDKQSYLIAAIPQMIARLVTPNCVDSKGNDITTASGAVLTADPTLGTCAMGSPEFTAVHDMHIGVVTSSLGPRLGVQENATTTSPIVYVCEPSTLVQPMAGGPMISAFNDDEGHLINRTEPYGSGAALPNAVDMSTGGGFLYWFPSLGNSGKTAASPPAAPYTQSGVGTGITPTAGTLVYDFGELVGGAGESGCGIESQLESWYRFLVQPDPYLTLVNSGGKATWSGVDTTILQQRHDFLRPDSLLAVIVLTDENDSEIDVRSFQGSGYLFMSNTYSPPRATSACTKDPNNTTGMCASCAGCGTTGGPGTAVCNDPNCKTNGGAFTSNADGDDWGYNLNLRHVHMQQKYALNPQYPLTRYYNGLTSSTVPNRLGEYPSATSSYAGNNNCTNPLFAATLPDPATTPIADSMSASPAEISTSLCMLSTGAIRTPADVFYAHIGGVPHELLQAVPGSCTTTPCPEGTCAAGTAAEDCPQKSTLASADWIKILGQGPASYTGTGGTQSFDYTGIDPHMIESMLPRNGMAGTVPCSGSVCLGAIEPTPASSPAVSSLTGPALGTGADPVRPDPINGREWTTYAGVHSLPVDRQYACIFQLPVSSQRDCAVLKGTSIEGNSCDCDPGNMSGSTTTWNAGGPAGPTNNTPDEIPPLCSKTSTDSPPSITSSVSDYTVQTYAKAYPTIRELMLANMMGAQGIVSSLCPIHTNDNSSGDDPLYGYRPAVNAIVDRLKNALGSQCVPELVATTTNGSETVPCLVLVSFGPTSGGPAKQGECASQPGGYYTEPDATTLQEFKQSQTTTSTGDAGSANANSIANEVTCVLTQVPIPAAAVGTPTGTCVNGATPGWCYVTGMAVGGGSTCSQQISYSGNSIVPNGATINLQCISTNTAADAAAPAAAGDGG